MQIKALKEAKPVLEADVKALRQGVEDILERVRREGRVLTLPSRE
jgi:hypothetical protein